jgi:hypothetical protein
MYGDFYVMCSWSAIWSLLVRCCATQPFDVSLLYKGVFSTCGLWASRGGNRVSTDGVDGSVCLEKHLLRWWFLHHLLWLYRANVAATVLVLQYGTKHEGLEDPAPENGTCGTVLLGTNSVKQTEQGSNAWSYCSVQLMYCKYSGRFYISLQCPRLEPYAVVSAKYSRRAINNLSVSVGGRV